MRFGICKESRTLMRFADPGILGRVLGRVLVWLRLKRNQPHSTTRNLSSMVKPTFWDSPSARPFFVELKSYWEDGIGNIRFHLIHHGKEGPPDEFLHFMAAGSALPDGGKGGMLWMRQMPRFWEKSPVPGSLREIGGSSHSRGVLLLWDLVVPGPPWPRIAWDFSNVSPINVGERNGDVIFTNFIWYLDLPWFT